jgi:hypothetical protein
VLAGGSGEDAHALAAAVALSRRARHPVSGALAELGAALGRRLPDVAVADFRLVAGARPPGRPPRGVARGARAPLRAVPCGSGTALLRPAR